MVNDHVGNSIKLWIINYLLSGSIYSVCYSIDVDPSASLYMMKMIFSSDVDTRFILRISQYNTHIIIPIKPHNKEMHKNHTLLLYRNIDQKLVNSLHGLLNCEIGELDCHVITTEYRTRVHCIHM